MAVIEDLDPLGATVEAEGDGKALEQAALRTAFGQAPRERFARVAQGVIDELALGTAPRPDEASSKSRTPVWRKKTMPASTGAGLP